MLFRSFFEVEDQTSDPPPPPPPPTPHHDENDIDALSDRVAALEKDVTIIKAMIQEWKEGLARLLAEG